MVMLKDGDRDVAFSLLSIAISLALLYEGYRPKYEAGAGDYGFSPVFLPLILIYGWLGLSVLILLRGLVLRKKQETTGVKIDLSRSVTGFVLTCAYAFLMSQIGFFAASVLYAFAFMTILGYRRTIPLLAVSIIFPALMWYVFTFLLNVSLPLSPWFSRI
jgi:putative tricarboxylic transport membrane protein